MIQLLVHNSLKMLSTIFVIGSSDILYVLRCRDKKRYEYFFSDQLKRRVEGELYVSLRPQ